jgi:hypothetical protein
MAAIRGVSPWLAPAWERPLTLGTRPPTSLSRDASKNSGGCLTPDGSVRRLASGWRRTFARSHPGSFAKNPEDKEITGRLDIRYVANGGRHVIVERKRYSVNDDVTQVHRAGTQVLQGNGVMGSETW